MPQSFIKEPNSLGFTGFSSVLMHSCCKEETVPQALLLGGGEVGGNTFLLLQHHGACQLPLAVSEFPTALLLDN